jgi:PEP-CTERM motif
MTRTGTFTYSAAASLILASAGLASTITFSNHEQAGAAIGTARVRSSTVPNSGTGQLYADSETFNVSNQTVTPAGFAGPVAGPGFGLLAPLPNTGPTVTAPAPLNKAPGSFYSLDSSSIGTVAPIGSAEGFASMNTNAAGTNVTLTAKAVDINNIVALGRAVDPWYFGPGPSLFDETLTNLTLSASPGTLGAGYGLSMDSSLPGLNHLYDLEIVDLPGVASPGNLMIQFHSNPALGWNDAAIMSMVLSDFSFSGDTATLTTPFDLSFSLNSTQSYSLSYAVEAEAAASTPEPSTTLLVGAGLIGVGLLFRRRAAKM